MKIRYLSEEAKIIRHEERKAPNPRTFWGLRRHRVDDVRPEQRASLLAYGFIRGKPYRSIEPKAHDRPNVRRVARLATKYGTGRVPDREIEAWLEGDVAQLAERSG